MPNIVNNNIPPIDSSWFGDDVQKKLDDLVKQINEYIVGNCSYNFKNIQDQLAPMSTRQVLEPDTIVNHTTETIEVIGNGNVVLTNVPTISAGYPGKRLSIIGLSDANTVTFQSELNLAGSNLQVPVDITLGEGDVLNLIYSKSIGKWVII